MLPIAASRAALLGASALRYLLKALFGTKQGFVVDAHGENHLTNNAGVTAVAGKVGSAAQFVAASSQYLSIADNADLSMGDIDFTVGAWVYLDSKGTDRPILGKYKSGDQEYLLQFANGSDRFTFQVRDLANTGTTTRSAATLGAPSTGTWYFVLAWHDSIANTINIQANDGVVDSSAYTIGVRDGTAAFDMGRYNTTALFDGRIDQAFVTKRVLTTQERTDFYNAGAGLAYSALTTAHKVSMVAFWEFEPLPASLPVDVGGPLTVVDTTNLLSQSAALLSFGGRVTTGDPGVWGPSMARVAGRTMLCRVILPGTSVRAGVGWDSNQSASLTPHSLIFGNSGVIDLVGPSVLTVGAYSATTYEVAIVLRNTGAYWLIKGGAFTAWTLLWVDNSLATTPLFAAVTSSNTTGIFTADNFRVLDLALYDARFATDYGLAYGFLADGNTAPALIIPVAADFWVSCSFVYVAPTSDLNIRVRYTDGANYWRIRALADGSLRLYEVSTSRAIVAGVFPSTATYEVRILVEGIVIKVWVNNVLHITYSSAALNQGLGYVAPTIPTPEAITTIAVWPRTLTLRSDI